MSNLRMTIEDCDADLRLALEQTCDAMTAATQDFDQVDEQTMAYINGRAREAIFMIRSAQKKLQEIRSEVRLATSQGASQ